MMYIVKTSGTTMQIRAQSFHEAIEKAKQTLFGYWKGQPIKVRRI